MMSSSRGDAPLVTFVVFSYNQQPFIREAVEAAFAQTYSPLEIILSDDCSQDGSFETMASLAAAYQGPHRVRLNRNETNLGISRHHAKVMGLASGELIVGASGDDVSLPARVEAIVRAWQAHGCPVCEVHSLWREMTPEGEVLPPVFGSEPAVPSDPVVLLRRWGLHPKGAVCAYSKQVFEFFGSLQPECPCEDVPIAWRAAMLGRIIFVPEVLVHWRRGTGVWGGADYSTTEARLKTWQRFVSEMRRLGDQAVRDAAQLGLEGRAVACAAARLRRETEALFKLKECGLRPFLAGCLRYACRHLPSCAMLKTANRRFMIGTEGRRALSFLAKVVWWLTR